MILPILSKSKKIFRSLNGNKIPAVPMPGILTAASEQHDTQLFQNQSIAGTNLPDSPAILRENP